MAQIPLRSDTALPLLDLGVNFWLGFLWLVLVPRKSGGDSGEGRWPATSGCYACDCRVEICVPKTRAETRNLM
ncbi:hypothetical protein MUK42_34594 [Musa troglodytarum]|uniref:Uncharacterized protein n=1 Tax=Musa troglodytarum TaxID=320322 RepID=A0A9E7GIV3_9LILI|nr:hypothetical protein MUK42_34594 [Musa troglodytarum]